VADPARPLERAPWREWTLVHLIRGQAGERGDRPSVRFEDGQAFTFRALDAWTDELASSLAAGGEDEVKACVVPAAGVTIDPVEPLDWCSPRMPHFAVPRFVEVVSGELAKTPTGKLQKTPLREAGITATTWDRESVGYVVRR